MVVGEGLLSAARFALRVVPAATLSRWRSSRTLVEASHLPRLGRIFNCGFV